MIIAPHLLFANATADGDGKTAVLVVISGILGSALTWLANFLSARAAKKRENEKEDEKDTIAHYERLLARVTEERFEERKEVRLLREESLTLREEVRRLSVYVERYKSRVQHLTEMIEQQTEIRLKPWSEDEDRSEVHVPLSTPNKGGGI